MNSEQNEQQVLWDALDYFELKELESLDQEVRNLEQERITDALCIHEGNRSKAAKTLGIGRTLLIHKIKKYNL
jgi:transcriptional regulator with PAS, ATPase and Fis domain